MNVEILRFFAEPNRRSLGKLIVRYHDLILRCELVFYPKEQKAWIRMPEMWLTQDRKMGFCHWPTREISDSFQKAVLEKLFSLLSLDKTSVAKMHAEYRLTKRKKLLK